MSLEEMIIECESLGKKKLAKPCQLRIQSYYGNPDKEGWWCADLITYSNANPIELTYSDFYGEADTVTGAIQDLISALGDM